LVTEVTGLIGLYYLCSEYFEHVEVKADRGVSVKELNEQQIKTVKHNSLMKQLPDVI